PTRSEPPIVIDEDSSVGGVVVPAAVVEPSATSDAAAAMTAATRLVERREFIDYLPPLGRLSPPLDHGLGSPASRTTICLRLAHRPVSVNRTVPTLAPLVPPFERQ